MAKKQTKNPQLINLLFFSKLNINIQSPLYLSDINQRNKRTTVAPV